MKKILIVGNEESRQLRALIKQAKNTNGLEVKIIDEMIKYKVRCLGYDSPEMKPSLKKENREEEKEKAKEAKTFFQNLVNFNNNGLTYIHIHEFDKYGRLLGTFYNDSSMKGDSINDIMIKNGHGYSYFGGTKKEF